MSEVSSKPPATEEDKKFRFAVTRAVMRQREIERQQVQGLRAVQSHQMSRINMAPRDPSLGVSPSEEQLSRNPSQYPFPEEILSSRGLTMSVNPIGDQIENQPPFGSSESPIGPSISRMPPILTLVPPSVLPTVNQLINDNPNVEDLDSVVNDIIDDLRIEAISEASSAYRKSLFFKCIDVTLRITMVVLGIVVGVFGKDAYSGSSSSGIALAVTIMGFTFSGLSEFREQFSFKERSLVLMKCYQSFNRVSQDLRILKVSGKSAEEMLVEVVFLENKSNQISMNAFDSQIVKSGALHEFNTVPKVHQDPPAIVRPGDIPIQKTAAVGDPNEEPSDIRIDP